MFRINHSGVHSLDSSHFREIKGSKTFGVAMANLYADSILARLPLTTFWVDDRMDICEAIGQSAQKVAALKAVMNDEITLTDLPFNRALEGKKFSELPRPYQRRITQTYITIEYIAAATDEEMAELIGRVDAL